MDARDKSFRLVFIANSNGSTVVSKANVANVNVVTKFNAATGVVAQGDVFVP